MKLLAINHNEKLSQQTVESKFMAVQCLLMGQRNRRLVSSRAAFFLYLNLQEMYMYNLK